MDNLYKKLVELKEFLEKANVMASPKAPRMPSIPKIDQPAMPKQPDLTPSSKKNPVNVAQQIEDPSAKAQALKMAKEKIKLAKNGQWSLEKVFPVSPAP